MSVVYVHIGLPKTGTTHLQDRLWRNRDLALKHSGLLYPGNRIDDHFHAAVHLQPARYLDWVDPAFDHSWPQLVAQMKAWPQKSLLSHELYATATNEDIDRLVGDLSFADEIHVIATVRDLGRQLPSVWQENVKNQRRASFDDFLDAVHAHAPGTGESGESDRPEVEPFWEFQDHVRILRTWAGVVGPANVHVVTVPTKGASSPDDNLWTRFLSVLGADPAVLDVGVPALNQSLSAGQTEMLRRLNERLQPDDVGWQRYERVVKGQLIGEILFEAPSGKPRLLTDAQRPAVARRADEMVDAIADAGYRVHGSLEDLRVAAAGDARVDGEPSLEQVLDVALDTLAEVVKRAPLPKTGPRMKTRVANVVRRIRRRMRGLRTA